MEIVHKNEAQEFKNSNTCSAFEYKMKEKAIDGAVIKLEGRYPEKGLSTNLQCKMISFVLSGSGKVVVEGKEISLQEGDLILILANEKYFWEGSMTLFISSTPAWSPDQYRQIE